MALPVDLDATHPALWLAPLGGLGLVWGDRRHGLGENRSTGVLLTLCSTLLAGLTLAPRLHEPLLGLFVLVSLALLVGHTWGLLPDGESEDQPGWSGVGAWLLSIVVVAVVTALPAPRAWVVLVLVLGLGAEVWTQRRDAPWFSTDVVEDLMVSPARALAVSFATVAAGGSLLLMVPAASVRPGSISFVDAVFTSVSAVCVTGLIVLDTPNDLTGFGQLVVLMLIQVGGLGTMTFAALVAIVLGRRMGLREEALAAEMVGGPAVRHDLASALQTVFKVTFLVELVGAVGLSALFFWDGDALGVAVWRGVFTSISAFCNAGFALQSDSLVPYATHSSVLLVVSLLIVCGGLGPAVVVALPKLGKQRLSLHMKLVLWVTAALLLAPMAAMLALEWSGTLGSMSLSEKLVNAWFQSVTLRTAGFNSVDLAQVQPATWTLMLVCMFVGGSPGSTAGGIKTTTLAVLVLAAVAAVRGRREAEVFSRRIPHRVVYEAAAIVTVGVFSLVAGLMALQVTQQLALDETIFEVVSALGTVGLSTGATGQLDAVGKVVLVMLMFAGRVGPLTLFVVLMGRRSTSRRYPLESLQVG